MYVAELLPRRRLGPFRRHLKQANSRSFDGSCKVADRLLRWEAECLPCVFRSPLYVAVSLIGEGNTR